jgi:endoglucanase
MQRGWLFRLVPVLVAGCALCAAGAETQRAADPFLKAAGNDLRDGRGTGQVVVLRGVNLGGWLNLEPWMTPMDSSGLKDEWSALDVLEKRFGRATRDRLFDVYRDAYITERDLDNIAALKLNLVRLPFWYRNFQEEDGTWRPDAFRRIDWLVAAAWKRGIYTVLDLHGAPGGQSDKDGTGRVRRKELNGLTPELWGSEENIRRTEEIWTRIAGRYRGNPAVAAYDLLNEPMGAPSRDAIWALYDRLYRAIRAVDPDHIISVESSWSGNVEGRQIGWCWEILPPLKRFGWSNMLYQFHNYEWDWSDHSRQVRSTDHMVSEWLKHKSWGVPCFIGEFNCMNAGDAWRHTFATYATNGMSWALWNYKSTAGTGDNSWGLYNPKVTAPQKPNLQKDSVELIAAKWSMWSTAGLFAINPMIERALREAEGGRPEAAEDLRAKGRQQKPALP